MMDISNILMIILTFGLFAVAFFQYKYYKDVSEHAPMEKKIKELQKEHLDQRLQFNDIKKDVEYTKISIDKIDKTIVEIFNILREKK